MRSRSSGTSMSSTTMCLRRSSRPIRATACSAASRVAATVRLLPLVIAMLASWATVAPASPTTLVKAPSPISRAPLRSAIRAAWLSRS